MAIPLIRNTRATATGTAAIGLYVHNSAAVHNSTLRGSSSDVTLEAAATLDADNADYGTITVGAAGVVNPLAGDRAVFDALDNAARHTNDADDSATAIHHTLGTGAAQAATGNHTHAGSLSNALTNTHIFVGNVSNIATDVAMSNDATMANTGALTLKNTGPGATGPLGGATVAPIITIDAQGRVTALTSTTITGVTPAAHQLTGALHTESGLTVGDVLTALTATTFGFATPSSGGIPQVYNETQTADGSSTIYYLTNYASPSTIRVYIDGIRQPASDDVAPTDVVSFGVAPDLGAVLLFDYEMDLT